MLGTGRSLQDANTGSAGLKSDRAAILGAAHTEPPIGRHRPLVGDADRIVRVLRLEDHRDDGDASDLLGQRARQCEQISGAPPRCPGGVCGDGSFSATRRAPLQPTLASFILPNWELNGLAVQARIPAELLWASSSIHTLASLCWRRGRASILLLIRVRRWVTAALLMPRSRARSARLPEANRAVR